MPFWPICLPSSTACLPRWKCLNWCPINLFLALLGQRGARLGCLLQQGIWPHRPRQGNGVRFCQPHRPHAHGQRPRRRLGDCPAAVLDWSGYDVTRGLYINDAGNQIQKFGKSLAVRCLQQFCGEEVSHRPLSAIRAATASRCWPVSLLVINGDKYVAACSGLDEGGPLASEAFEALKNALWITPAQEHCGPLSATWASTASITMSGSTRAPCTNPALSWML